jgi:glycosyltransferase involved in cell wall biosynthesis
VWEHVSRSSYRGIVVSHNAVEHRDAFPHRPVHHLDRLARHVPERRWPDVRTTVLRGIAAVHRAHLVHVHFGYVVGDVTEMTRRSGAGLVLSLHGADATELPLRQRSHYDGVVEQVDAVIVPSNFLQGVAHGLGFPDERIHVIPAGIDTSFFSATPLPREPVVTFVGRLVEKKGLDVLLQAWPDVARAVPGARLDILGTGPLVDAIPVGDATVHHVPPQPQRRREQVREAIRAARLVVSPSRTARNGDAESLLLVNLEAQATGRPVVSTRHGGIPEFVADDVSGLLVEENDVDQLRDAMIRVLTDDALARRLAGAGPAHAAQFDVRACVARVDVVYDEVLRRRGRK